MRFPVIATLLVLTAASTASADIPGVYDVKFEETTTNCQSPLRYTPTKLTIVVKGNTLTVDLDRTPLMVGVPAKTGAINAKSKAGSTMIEGMKGVFSVAGKVTPEGLLHLLMVGEYTTANGKPLCTQSWNVTGPKESKPAPKKTSRAAVHDREERPIMDDLVHLARVGR
jgi:hypothetical protein